MTNSKLRVCTIEYTNLCGRSRLLHTYAPRGAGSNESMDDQQLKNDRNTTAERFSSRKTTQAREQEDEWIIYWNADSGELDEARFDMRNRLDEEGKAWEELDQRPDEQGNTLGSKCQENAGRDRERIDGRNQDPATMGPVPGKGRHWGLEKDRRRGDEFWGAAGQTMTETTDIRIMK